MRLLTDADYDSAITTIEQYASDLCVWILNQNHSLVENRMTWEEFDDYLICSRKGNTLLSKFMDKYPGQGRFFKEKLLEFVHEALDMDTDYDDDGDYDYICYIGMAEWPR